MTWKGTVLPSANAAIPASARPTTCAFVSRNPSSVKTTADPAPAANRPSTVRRDTCSAATRGVSSAATAVTTSEYASRAPIPALLDYMLTRLTYDRSAGFRDIQRHLSVANLPPSRGPPVTDGPHPEGDGDVGVLGRAAAGRRGCGRAVPPAVGGAGGARRRVARAGHQGRARLRRRQLADVARGRPDRVAAPLVQGGGRGGAR